MTVLKTHRAIIDGRAVTVEQSYKNGRVENLVDGKPFNGRMLTADQLVDQYVQQFPNGFTKWLQVYTEAVLHMSLLLENDNVQLMEEISDSVSFFETAKRLTDAFEKQNIGAEFQGEFAEAVWLFVDEQYTDLTPVVLLTDDDYTDELVALDLKRKARSDHKARVVEFARKTNADYNSESSHTWLDLVNAKMFLYLNRF